MREEEDKKERSFIDYRASIYSKACSVTWGGTTGGLCGILTACPGSPASPGLPWKPCGPWDVERTERLLDERENMFLYALPERRSNKNKIKTTCIKD